LIFSKWFTSEDKNNFFVRVISMPGKNKTFELTVWDPKPSKIIIRTILNDQELRTFVFEQNSDKDLLEQEFKRIMMLHFGARNINKRFSD
jgi:hypothetical protein